MKQLRILQGLIAVLALIPIGAGIAGMLLGPGFLGAQAPWAVDLDSQLRFLSGVFLVVGLGWWSCVPNIADKGPRLRLLVLMTFVGGLARLFSLSQSGLPSTGHLGGLAMELVIAPLLVAWHARIVASFPRRRN